ncbi:hypothetical protein BC829DRAFT_405659, partial [Chytridium lagenaria]
MKSRDIFFNGFRNKLFKKWVSRWKTIFRHAEMAIKLYGRNSLLCNWRKWNVGYHIWLFTTNIAAERRRVCFQEKVFSMWLKRRNSRRESRVIDKFKSFKLAYNFRIVSMCFLTWHYNWKKERDRIESLCEHQNSKKVNILIFVFSTWRMITELRNNDQNCADVYHTAITTRRSFLLWFDKFRRISVLNEKGTGFLHNSSKRIIAQLFATWVRLYKMRCIALEIDRLYKVKTTCWILRHWQIEARRRNREKILTAFTGKTIHSISKAAFLIWKRLKQTRLSKRMRIQKLRSTYFLSWRSSFSDSFNMALSIKLYLKKIRLVAFNKWYLRCVMSAWGRKQFSSESTSVVLIAPQFSYKMPQNFDRFLNLDNVTRILVICEVSIRLVEIERDPSSAGWKTLQISSDLSYLTISHLYLLKEKWRNLLKKIMRYNSLSLKKHQRQLLTRFFVLWRRRFEF